MHIGNNLKNIRTSLGISQRELGRRINMTGQMISRIEQNTTTPSMDTLDKIASTLGVDVIDLVATKQETITLNDSLDHVIDELGYGINYLLERSACSAGGNNMITTVTINKNDKKITLKLKEYSAIKKEIASYIDFRLNQELNK